MSEETQVADAPVDAGQATSETTEFNFKEHIDEELRNDPSLASYTSINGMAKSLINAQKMVGADKVVIPGKYTTEDEMNSFYSKIGRPDTPDGYEIKPSETIGEEGVDFFRQMAHKHGLTQQQAVGIFSEYGEYVGSATDKSDEQIEQIQLGIEADLKKEWGDQYQAKLNTSNEVVDYFVPEGTASDDIIELQLADGTRLGDHPKVIEMFANIGDFIGEKIGEDSFSGRDSVPGIALEEAERELNSIRAPGNTAYWDKNHPDHARSVQRALQLQEILTGDAA